MGLMKFWGKGPLSEKKIGKAVKLATNPYAQPDVRVRELERLLEDGSDEAITGALKRFSVNANSTIVDEEEKKWLEDQVVDFSEQDAIKPLEAYIRVEKQLTYALRAYRRLSGDSKAIGLFIDALEGHGPDAYRSADAKLQLVRGLGESLGDERVLPSLAPFLFDHSDDVRWAVMDLLEQGVDAQQVSDEVLSVFVDKISELIFDDATGPRISRRALEILFEREWTLSGESTVLPSLLEDEFFVDKKRFIRMRLKRSIS
ncbi:MAG: hypothetical protein VX699_13585 [Myxococcota bacterium]|nr:hypothetical protein [Myxococcota bacterium]